MLAFSQTQESEIEEVAAFLRRIFGVKDDHRVFLPEVLRWKFFSPHPDWEGSRSIICRSNGVIASHGCIVPFRFLTSTAEIKAANVVDWAASRDVPGSGLLLYRYAQDFVQAIIGIGGTEDTLAVLPKAGFKPVSEMQGWTRVLRPMAHASSATDKGLKTAMRFARDLKELTRSSAPVPPNWKAERVSNFDDSLAAVFPFPSRIVPVVCARDAAFLNNMLACPAASMEGYVVNIGERRKGYFVFSKLQNECRVCDFQIASDNWEDWRRLLSLIVKTAEENPAITSLMVMNTHPRIFDLLNESGFRLTAKLPSLLMDHKKTGLGKEELALSYPEYDGWYL